MKRREYFNPDGEALGMDADSHMVSAVAVTSLVLMALMILSLA